MEVMKINMIPDAQPADGEESILLCNKKREVAVSATQLAANILMMTMEEPNIF